MTKEDYTNAGNMVCTFRFTRKSSKWAASSEKASQVIAVNMPCKVRTMKTKPLLEPSVHSQRDTCLTYNTPSGVNLHTLQQANLMTYRQILTKMIADIKWISQIRIIQYSNPCCFSFLYLDLWRLSYQLCSHQNDNSHKETHH